MKRIQQHRVELLELEGLRQRVAYAFPPPDGKPDSKMNSNVQMSIHAFARYDDAIVAAGVKRIDGDIVDVARAVSIDFHLGAVRSYSDDTPTEHGQFFSRPVNGIMETKVADGNVYPPVDAHADAIGRVVGAAALQEFRRTYIFNERF